MEHKDFKNFKKLMAKTTAERKKKAKSLKELKTLTKGLEFTEKGLNVLSAVLMAESEKGGCKYK